MTIFVDITKNIKVHIRNWTENPDHPFIILIMDGSRSAITSALLNLRNYEPDIDEIYVYAKDTYEPKHQLLISKWEKICIRHFKDSKSFH